MSELSVEEVIRLLDAQTQAGTSRIKVEVSEEQAEGTMVKKYHHGRCDVGSPWATGEVGNPEGCD